MLGPAWIVLSTNVHDYLQFLFQRHRKRKCPKKGMMKRGQALKEELEKAKVERAKEEEEVEKAKGEEALEEKEKAKEEQAVGERGRHPLSLFTIKGKLTIAKYPS